MHPSFIPLKEALGDASTTLFSSLEGRFFNWPKLDEKMWGGRWMSRFPFLETLQKLKFVFGYQILQKRFSLSMSMSEYLQQEDMCTQWRRSRGARGGTCPPIFCQILCLPLLYLKSAPSLC